MLIIKIHKNSVFSDIIFLGKLEESRHATQQAQRGIDILLHIIKYAIIKHLSINFILKVMLHKKRMRIKNRMFVSPILETSPETFKRTLSVKVHTFRHYLNNHFQFTVFEKIC